MEHHLPDQQFQAIVQRLMPGSKLLDALAMQGGISARMTLLEYETPIGDVKRVVVRQPGHMSFEENLYAASNEYRLLKLIHPLGLLAPEPLLLIDSDEDCSLSPCLILEYIPGHPVFTITKLRYYILQMASVLARVHLRGVSGPEYSILHKQNIDCLDMVTANTKMADYAIDVTRAYDKLASGTVPVHPGPLCLLHGDFWPGNLLFSDDESLIGVIDWEDACIGNPLSDLAISRLDVFCIFGEDVMKAFTAHYWINTGFVCTDLPYWDLCAVLRLARLIGSDLTGWVAYYQRFGRKDITEQWIKECCQVFIGQALHELK
jgi:aminoglycoside phosphotransferase (APT) family kinase protein